MSILSHIHTEPPPFLGSVHVLYSSRVPSSGDQASILFLPRLHSIFSSSTAAKWKLQLFLTKFKGSITPEVSHHVSSAQPLEQQISNRKIHRRRMKHEDALDALGPVSERGSTTAYVCGPRDMTDEVVDLLRGAEGMTEERVRCEKWW